MQQHDVDVTVGVEFRATVAADGDEGDLKFPRIAGLLEGCQRPVEQLAQQRIEHPRPAKAHLATAAAVAVPPLQAG